MTAGDTEYCVLDIEFPVEGYHDLVLRGIVSVSDAERDFRYTLRLALILSPALVLDVYKRQGYVPALGARRVSGAVVYMMSFSPHRSKQLQLCA